jgi:hypothetical protein
MMEVHCMVGTEPRAVPHTPLCSLWTLDFDERQNTVKSRVISLVSDRETGHWSCDLREDS